MIVDLIEGNILLNMKAKDTVSAIKELAELINMSNIDKNKLVDDLIEREKLGSTGIGRGIAIPHVRTDALNRLVIAFGRTKKGIDFNALDNKPVHLFFLIASPEDVQDEYLNTLARISRLLKDEKLREQLIKAKTEDEIIALFREKEE